MTPDTRDLAENVVALESELAENPSPRTFAPLAEAYRLLGRLEDAVKTASTGVESYPGHAGIRVVLARALSDAGDEESALDAFRTVLELDPDNLEATAFVTGHGAPEASPPASEALEGPESIRATTGTLSEELAHLADLFAPLSDARRDWRSDDELSGIATLTLAEIYSRQGLNDKAAEVCKTILEREP
jgi:tetratricopeptide (TPR) repeat protein